MRRTQLYLDEDKYQFVKTLAKNRKESMAQVVRDIIGFYITDFKQNDPLFEVIGIADREEDIASNYEDYLSNIISSPDP